ncbi:methionyl-tRNA formyltransferase [Corynebacterium sp. P7202]|uniref:Methionyl-tRNA formyltransferase n=1 Tax=Corynebacterium pygosceleis TaxID=2800406 RepID=A0A9Q4C809_9CORY|nr:methionyl-tRNA formyltransferase [Corynebacterium pygosceleis]MCK7637527.1 methionyl-tRNA formyltransferase [Corynebacterium pygosceleis]MCX7444944.1 methionyl-tRNA formyltransferase [Corynebacterium pygosceleis]MCX7468144.1 methionyl-tRNA formyltransferase [Corynebacterium pygosceleis]
MTIVEPSLTSTHGKRSDSGMRVIFTGFATFGYRSITALADSGHEIVLVCTQPPIDDPYYAGMDEDVAAFARGLGIPVIETKRLDGVAAEAIREADADLMVVTNWTSVIARDVYDAPRLGTLNIHDSLLPKYAGFGAPNWALINDESEVGVTGHLMAEGFDTGPIVAQRATRVTDSDDALTLTDRCLDLVGPVLRDSLDALDVGREPTPQDPEQWTYFHRRRPADCGVDFALGARAVFNLVRASCDPFFNAWVYLGDQLIYLIDVEVSPVRFGGTPGRVVTDGEHIVVVAGPAAHTGREQGVQINRIRLADGTDIENPGQVIRPGMYLLSAPA